MAKNESVPATQSEVQDRNNRNAEAIPADGAAHVARGEQIRNQVYSRMEARTKANQAQRPVGHKS
jgi:hypothetical protein